MNLSTVSTSYPNSAVALDEQITAKVIQLVGTVRPDLETLLLAGVNTGSAEELDQLAAFFVFAVTATDTMTPVLFTAELIQ